MKILIHPSLELSLIELIENLYEKEYFSYLENAEDYVDKIIFFIKNNISKRRSKEATNYFKRLTGEKELHYVFYRANKNTTWYIFFVMQNDIFLILHIANNHTDGHHILGLK